MIKLAEVYREREVGASNSFVLRAVYVNPSHVVCMYDDTAMSMNLREGFLPQDLDQRQSFTKLHLNQGQSVRQMTVVGGVDTVSEKLGLSLRRRQLLHD